MQKRPLLGLTLAELQNVVKNLGMPGFSAKQIASWLYDKKVASIDEMSNLSLKHRELLKEIYEVGAEAPVDAIALCRRYGEILIPGRRGTFRGSCLYTRRRPGYALCLLSGGL